MSDLLCDETHLQNENEHLERILAENTELMAELQNAEDRLSTAERALSEIEGKYVRLLEISSDKAQTQIDILLREENSRTPKVSCRESEISMLRQRLSSFDVTLTSAEPKQSE